MYPQDTLESRADVFHSLVHRRTAACWPSEARGAQGREQRPLLSCGKAANKHVKHQMAVLRKIQSRAGRWPLGGTVQMTPEPSPGTGPRATYAPGAWGASSRRGQEVRWQGPVCHRMTLPGSEVTLMLEDVSDPLLSPRCPWNGQSYFIHNIVYKLKLWNKYYSDSKHSSLSLECLIDKRYPLRFLSKAKAVRLPFVRGAFSPTLFFTKLLGNIPDPNSMERCLHSISYSLNSERKLVFPSWTKLSWLRVQILRAFWDDTQAVTAVLYDLRFPAEV